MSMMALRHQSLQSDWKQVLQKHLCKIEAALDCQSRQFDWADDEGMVFAEVRAPETSAIIPV